MVDLLEPCVMRDQPLLQGIVALSLRSELQAQDLTHTVEALGGHLIHVPTFDIMPYPFDAGLEPKLTDYHYAFFMSPNAVAHSISSLLGYWKTWPDRIRVGVVGGVTRKALLEKGIPVHFCPTLYQSEALLEILPASLVGKKALIIRGEQGCKVLDLGLMQRGAFVDEMIVYKRCLPTQGLPHNLLMRLEQEPIHIVLCMSVESLKNLSLLLTDALFSKLKALPWIFLSQRIADHAETFGITHYYIAESGFLAKTLLAVANSLHLKIYKVE